MAQAASRLPLTEEAQLRSQANPVGFMVNEVVLGQVSVRALQSSPVSVIAPVLHTR